MPREKKAQKTGDWLHVPVGLSMVDIQHGPRRTELRPTSLPLGGILAPCTVRAVSGECEFSSTHPR